MPQQRLTPDEVRFLKLAFDADWISSNLRLREGEYQNDLVKMIASFHLNLCFPDVKNIVERLYGKEKTEDVQFIRKVQTILKKLEKSNIVKILPKRKPWELQRYGLSSFKFQDADKNAVIFATEQEIEQAKVLLSVVTSKEGAPSSRLSSYWRPIAASLLLLFAAMSYVTIVWDVTQATVNPLILVSALIVAAACSLALGRALSKT